MAAFEAEVIGSSPVALANYKKVGDIMTDKRIAEILKGITILIDSRENVNHEITDYFDANGIKYMTYCLKFGDYSFLSPPIPEFGYYEQICFEKCIAVEKKANLTELSGNLAQNRERFENELQRAKDIGAKLILMVEGGGWQGIIEHKYGTNLSEKSFIGSLLSFSNRYGVEVQFIPQKYAGMFIHQQFYYWLRNWIKTQIEN